MNRIRVFAGLVATVALFSLTSCITIDHTLGSSLVPSDQYITVNVVDMDLPVHQALADSLQTFVGGPVTFGSIRSKDFECFDAMGVFSITPDQDSLILGDNPVFKDIYATFSLSFSQQLDTNEAYIPQNIYMYQLNKELDSTMIYSCSITEKDLKPVPIHAANTIFTGESSFFVPLTEEFAKPILDLPFEILDSAQLFMKAFYGIAIMTDKREEERYGGRLNTLDLTSSYIYLTYESTNWEGRRRDTTIAFALGEHYALSSFKTESGRLIEPDRTDEIIYMDGLSGIKPVIYARELREIIDEWANSKGIDLNYLLVTRAAIIFPFEYSGRPDDYDYFPENLYPSRRIADTLGRKRYTPIDESDEEDLLKGTINMTFFHYRSDASIYLQEIIRRDPSSFTLEDDLWMTSLINYSTSSVTAYYTDYSYYYQCRLNGMKSERHPYLRLTYSLLQ